MSEYYNDDIDPRIDVPSNDYATIGLTIDESLE
jgi:hypothetical protein